jgi:hypothetical protein
MNFQSARLRKEQRYGQRPNPSSVNPYDARSSGGLPELIRHEQIRNLEFATNHAWAQARKYTEADNPEVYAHARQVERKYFQAKYGR